jgi:hypothetical protein
MLPHRNRKRLPSALAPAPSSSPVTRSGKVRRTSGGLVSGDPGPAAPAAAAGGGGACGSDRGPAERVYITVDGGRSTKHFLRLCLRSEAMPEGGGVRQPLTKRDTVHAHALLVVVSVVSDRT